MSARYLVRLDDACATMDHARWNAVEAVLDELEIRPIIGVTPDNRDPNLMLAPADPAFWDRVRSWQAKGWSIAMHGLHHLLHYIDRRRLIIPFYDHSEFAGLDDDAQAALIARSWALFEAEGVRPTIWMAPGHSFDWGTLRAIERETPIRVISDGLTRDYIREAGFTWLPQQLWEPQPRANGLWTICLHPNVMSDNEIHELRDRLAKSYYRKRTVAVSELALKGRRRSVVDVLYTHYFLARARIIKGLMPAYQVTRRILTRTARA
jgi:predicted deacetylase